MATFHNQACEILDEHKAVLALLHPLERALASLGTDAEEARLVEHILRFFEYFVEEYHHNKEEGEFFQALRSSGLLQTADMLHADHRNGITQLKALQRALAAASRGDAKAIAFLRAEGSHYAALTREHIRQENEILEVLVADGSKKAPGAETGSTVKAATLPRCDQSAGGRAR